MNKNNKATLSATGASYGANQQHHAANHAAIHSGSTEPYPVNVDNPDTLLLGCKKLVGQRLTVWPDRPRRLLANNP